MSSLERRSSTSRLKVEKVDKADDAPKEGAEEEKKHGLLSKLGVRTSKRLSISGSPKVEKPAAPEPANPSDFHYKGHRPTHEEMVAHLESFTRSRTPTLEASNSACVPRAYRRIYCSSPIAFLCLLLLAPPPSPSASR